MVAISAHASSITESGLTVLSGPSPSTAPVTPADQRIEKARKEQEQRDRQKDLGEKYPESNSRFQELSSESPTMRTHAHAALPPALAALAAKEQNASVAAAPLSGQPPAWNPGSAMLAGTLTSLALFSPDTFGNSQRPGRISNVPLVGPALEAGILAAGAALVAVAGAAKALQGG